MSWLLPRIAAGVLALLGGAALGYVIGHPTHGPQWSVLTGAVCGVLALAIADALRGMRLIRWLRGAHDDPAPRDAGLWGEVAYRAERAIRAHAQAARQEQTRLQQLLQAIEAAPNGVVLLDANDQVDWCNGVAAEHFGLDPRRDVRQRITNLARAPAFVAYLQGGRWDEPVTYANPRRPGTLSVLVRPYGDGQKLVLSQDITEHERADGMRRDFVANVSHEIRTPLTVLAGFVETLSTLPLTEVERKRVLELMRQQTARMQSLVGDLLTLAQLEGSPPPATDRWVAVEQLFAQVEGDMRALSGGRHRIETHGRGGAAQIAGTEGELLSALANVANNAVRYTPEGGTIELLWSRRADGAGVVEVRDTGIGIAAEHLPRVTERFYRVDSSRSRETGGTGLGLSIVKHVLQRHGGELEVDSEPGKGSRFRLVFPGPRVQDATPRNAPR
jgi:two-component system phosphate regulon sensor histidine kinase PhoR